MRENGLSLVFLAFFVLAVAGQAIAGWDEFNNDATAHSEATIALGRYLTSSSFGDALLENWQSEYLQFTLYILLTVWFVQRGSPESKELDKAGGESDEDQMVGEHAAADSPGWASAGGVRTRLYANSLLIVMIAIWLLSWFGQSVTGWSEYNADQITHHEPTVTGSATSARPTSGRRRSRTGSPSSSRSARWPCSRSTCASAARRSPSRSEPRTTQPESKARPCPPPRTRAGSPRTGGGGPPRRGGWR